MLTKQLSRFTILLVCILLNGCIYRFSHTKHSQSVAVSSSPPGAWIWEKKGQGRRNLGKAPQTITKKYKKKFVHFNYGWWALPAVALGMVGAGGAMVGAIDDNGAKTGGITMLILGGLAALITLPAAIAATVTDGKRVGSTGKYSARIGASLPGYADAWNQVDIPGARKSLHLELTPTGSVPTTVDGEQSDRQRGIVAVFDLQDESRRFKKKTLDMFAELLCVTLTEVAGYKIVPRDQLRARLLEKKRQSYKLCYDESCQIELGKAVAANKSLATKIYKLGKKCILTSTLYDLKTETTDRAKSTETDCSVLGIIDGLKKISKQFSISP